MTPQEEARRELARRELARRQGQQPDAPIAYTNDKGQQTIAGLIAGQRGAGNHPKESALGAFARNGISGATLGADQHVYAGLNSLMPFGDAKFLDYKGNLEKVRAQNAAQDAAHGKSAVAGKTLGAMAGLARLGSLKYAPTKLASGKGLGLTTAAVAGEGAAAMGTNAALDGENPLTPAAQGGGIGGLANVLLRGSGKILNPIVKPIMSRINPSAAAGDALQEALKRSGQSIDDVANKFRAASADGNSEMMIADALGNEGQRRLSGLARLPGNERNRIADTLNQRQAGQGDRLGAGISDAFTKGETADQAFARLSEARRATDSVNYGAIPSQPVGIESTLKAIKEGTKSLENGLAPTRSEQVLLNFQKQLQSNRASRVASDRITEIRRAVRGQADSAYRSGDTDVATALNSLKNGLTEDTNAIPGFREANRISSQNARVRDAVREGQSAARPSSRMDDIRQSFSAMTPEQQVAYRVGTGSELVKKIEGAAFGVNKARPLTGQKAQGLLADVAGDGGKLARNVDRENLFFETRAAALGGSKTADNLADQAEAMGLLGSIARGDIGGAVKNVVTRGARAIQGQTPQVRAQIADVLLAKDPSAATQAIADAVRQGKLLDAAQMNTVKALTVGGILAANN